MTRDEFLEMRDAYIKNLKRLTEPREQAFERFRRNIRRARLRVHGAHKSSAKKSEIKVVWIEEHDSTTDDLIPAPHGDELEPKGE